jgi:thioredoxin reductase (NADPH)
VQQFDLKINTYEPVTEISRGGDGFAIQTRKGKYRARRIVLATGGTERPRRLNIPGEDLPHVSHYFQDPHPYFRQKLLIVGGKNSAVEAALRCHAVGASVSLCHRRAKIDSDRIKYWLWPEINGLMQSGKIPTYFNSQLVEIREGCVILRNSDGKTTEVVADFVLLLVGYESDMSLFRQAGVELTGDDHAPRFNPATMETNVPGIFVAGTASAGTQQRFAVFIENCHVHVERIMAAITGHSPPPSPRPLERPES